MSSARALPVTMPDIHGQCWSCHSCGHCCRSLVGELSDAERDRLDEQGWADKLPVEPYVRVGRGWVLNKHVDNTCVFLDEQNRCRIHSEFGESAKPLACRIFPFSVRPVLGAWQASLRFDCPSVVQSKGEPLRSHRASLRRLVADLEHELPPGNNTIALQRGLQATDDEVDLVYRMFSRWLHDGDVPLAQRLVGVARITTTLAGATLSDVRGPRFAELLDLLFGVLPTECAAPPSEPTIRQRGMLRQLAFAHAEHVTLAQRRAWFGSRLFMRGRQLRSARRFRRGKGSVPTLPGFLGSSTFDKVESVDASTMDPARVEDLLLRYLTARIEAKSVFGPGYYRFPLFTGLAALWLSLAVTGWLAQYTAAMDGRTTMGLEDVGAALGVVDRAATRLPALGTLAERARISYLLPNDGLARVVQHYGLLDPQK